MKTTNERLCEQYADHVALLRHLGLDDAGVAGSGGGLYAIAGTGPAGHPVLITNTVGGLLSDAEIGDWVEETGGERPGFYVGFYDPEDSSREVACAESPSLAEAYRWALGTVRALPLDAPAEPEPAAELPDWERPVAVGEEVRFRSGAARWVIESIDQAGAVAIRSPLTGRLRKYSAEEFANMRKARTVWAFARPDAEISA